MKTVADKAVAVGYVHIIKKNANGDVILEKVYKNQLTYYARQSSAQLWAGIWVNPANYIAIGTGQPPVNGGTTSPSDTALWSELSGSRKQCDFVTTWLQYNTQYSVTYQQTDAVATWYELGLFDASSGGNMWAHVYLPGGFPKANGDIVTVQWQVQHEGN